MDVVAVVDVTSVVLVHPMLNLLLQVKLICMTRDGEGKANTRFFPHFRCPTEKPRRERERKDAPQERNECPCTRLGSRWRLHCGGLEDRGQHPGRRRPGRDVMTSHLTIVFSNQHGPDHGRGDGDEGVPVLEEHTQQRVRVEAVREKEGLDWVSATSKESRKRWEEEDNPFLFKLELSPPLRP